jgi:hypothetical protein
MLPTFTTEACQGRQALRDAQTHAAANEAAARLDDDIQLGLRHFTDTFLDAIDGDLLAEADERRLREKYASQPTVLRHKIARNGRVLAAQRALHSLYNKHLSGAAASPEERAIAEHLHDLCLDYTARETDRRGLNVVTG